MAIESELSKVTYDADGSTTDFDITFDVLTNSVTGDAEDIKVIVTDTDGNETELTVTSDYTVDGLTVTTVATYASGYKVTIARDVPFTQGLDLVEGGQFSAKSVERAFDKLTLQNQQQQENIERVVRLPITESGNMVLPTVTQRSSRVLGFDASGNPIAATGITAAVTAFMETVLDDADAATARATLGVTLTNLGVSAFMQTLLDDADISAALATLGGISPPGIIQAFGGSSVPTGWLACDGAAVSRTTYARLFAEIGTAWGAGDGSTTFNIPDLRGAFLRGAGAHGSATKANGGAYTGPSVGLTQVDILQGHRHAISDPGHTHTVKAYQWGAASSDREVFHPSATMSGKINSSTTGVTVQNPTTDGVNGAPRTGDETRPFAAGVTYIIKT